MRAYVFGHRGRLGACLVERLSPLGWLTAGPDEADTWLLAVPTAAAPALLDRAGERTVIDLSGALKQQRAGRYALLTEAGTLLDGQPPRPGERLANPGCFASSVIVGVRRAGLAGVLRGPLHVSAIGGRSTAHKSQDGGLRLARRLSDHPHAAEVSQALGVEVASLALAVAYAQPGGILSIVTGTCDPDAPLDPGADRLDVSDVLGTAEVRHRLVREGERFTLGVALDNVRFPVDNAARLVAALATSR